VVQLSPLYHGVALVRAANLGHFTAGVAVHIAVLVAVAAAGITVASRRIERLLLS
jgi:lipooligosaccharide transport system permease protein